MWNIINIIKNNIFKKVIYSCEFSAAVTPVFSVTWFFINHSDLVLLNTVVMLNLFVETMMRFFKKKIQVYLMITKLKRTEFILKNIYFLTLYMSLLSPLIIWYSKDTLNESIIFKNESYWPHILVGNTGVLILSVRLRELSTIMMMVWPHHFLLPFWDDVTWLSVASRSAGLSEMKQRETAHGSGRRLDVRGHVTGVSVRAGGRER